MSLRLSWLILATASAGIAAAISCSPDQVAPGPASDASTGEPDGFTGVPILTDAAPDAALPLETYCPSLVAARAAELTRCKLLDPKNAKAVETQMLSGCSTTADLVRQGKAAFDAVAAKACIDALAASGCNLEGRLPSICSGVFGTASSAPSGSICSFDARGYYSSNCGAGTVCEANVPDGGIFCQTCQTAEGRAAGSKCSFDAECAPGGYCNAGKCTAFAKAGDPCKPGTSPGGCVDGTYCKANGASGTCTLDPSTGEACQPGQVCKTGVCLTPDGGSVGQCGPALADGEKCGRPSECAAHYCNPSGTCGYLAPGSACKGPESCGPSARCNAKVLVDGGIAGGTCAQGAGGALDQICKTNEHCDEALFCFIDQFSPPYPLGACSPRQDAGGACLGAGECGDGLSCVGGIVNVAPGKCQPLGDLNQACGGKSGVSCKLFSTCSPDAGSTCQPIAPTPSGPFCKQPSPI